MASIVSVANLASSEMRWPCASPETRQVARPASATLSAPTWTPTPTCQSVTDSPGTVAANLTLWAETVTVVPTDISTWTVET